MSRKSALEAWQRTNGDNEGSNPNAHGSVTKPGAHATPAHGSSSYSAYAQVSEPSEGGKNPAGKDSGNNKDALGRPGRFSRNASTEAVCKPDSKVEDACKEQLGTNIELNWKRYGHDMMQPKGPVSYKKNFNNPTDNLSDLKVKK